MLDRWNSGERVIQRLGRKRARGIYHGGQEAASAVQGSRSHGAEPLARVGRCVKHPFMEAPPQISLGESKKNLF